MLKKLLTNLIDEIETKASEIKMPLSVDYDGTSLVFDIEDAPFEVPELDMNTVFWFMLYLKVDEEKMAEMIIDSICDGYQEYVNEQVLEENAKGE